MIRFSWKHISYFLLFKFFVRALFGLMNSLNLFSCDGFHLGEDEITHATVTFSHDSQSFEGKAFQVGLVLDSLDDIHCLTEAKQKEEVSEQMPIMDLHDSAVCRIFLLPSSRTTSFIRCSISTIRSAQTPIDRSGFISKTKIIVE